MVAIENLTNDTEQPCTPFSMQDIQEYIDFFDFSESLGNRPDGGMPTAKCVIIANIMANFCAFRSSNFYYLNLNALIILQISIGR